MARGTQHRKRRPTANASLAAPAAKPAKKRDRTAHPSWEDQLFFSRLRVHTKWVFVFLAAAFGLGFVLFGVGSGTTGIGQAMQNFFSSSGGGGGASLSSLQRKASDNQKDPVAWRNLVNKLEQGQKTDEAITALEHYVSIKPKDESSLDELASLYARRASDYNNEWSQALYQLQINGPSGLFQPSASSKLGQALSGKDPITQLQVDQLNSVASNASQQLGLLSNKAESTYKRLAKLAPSNATYQFQLASIAQSLSQKAIATAAYKKFLALAPHDALAPRARAALKTLSAKPKTKTAPSAKK